MKKRSGAKKKSIRPSQLNKQSRGYKARTEKAVMSSANPERDESPERKAWREVYLKTKRKERYEDMVRLADSIEEIELATQTAAQDRLKRLFQLKEALSQKLSEKQMATVTEYLNDFDGKRAMTLIGYKPTSAQFNTVIRHPDVKKYLAVIRKINEINTGVTGEFVLNEFTKLAKVSAQDLYDKDGNIIPPHKLPPDVAAAVSEIKERSWIEGKGLTAKKITEVTYRLHNKLAALDALGKHTGIYEADNKQKASNVKMQFILPSNGRNTDLILDHDVEVIEGKQTPPTIHLPKE